MSLQDSGRVISLHDSGISFQDSGIEVMSSQDCDYGDFVDSMMRV